MCYVEKYLCRLETKYICTWWHI